MPSDIDRIRELEAARTPGEWVLYVDGHGESWIAVDGWAMTRRIAHVCTDPKDYGKANGEYLATALAALPGLITAIDERDARIASALESLNALAMYCLPWSDNAHNRLLEALRALDSDS